MPSPKINPKRIALIALLGAMAAVLSIVDAMLPAAVPVFGFKLGLANAVILFALYKTGIIDAAFVSVIKVLITALFAGTPVSFLFSLCGTLLAFAAMALSSVFLKKIISPLGVSIIGAFFHNLGQFAVSLFFFNTAVLSYLPFLVFVSALSGAVTGLVAAFVLEKTKKYTIFAKKS